jgi:sugar phosphate isomerase/epimerase
MLKQSHPPLHLTYCLNIHPGETWQENLRAIQAETAAVKLLVAPGEAFGLGLRLSGQAARQLSDKAALDNFRQVLRAQGMYAFTINGFPYGQFHGARVKEAVYEPDWRTTQRRDYTCQLADVLAALLPEGAEGSISTVPIAYKPRYHAEADQPQVIQRLMETVLHLHRLHESTGRLVHVGLEPEPDCVLETTDEAIRFFKQIWRDGPACLKGHLPAPQAEQIIRRHLGICFDTCHVALQFEEPSEMLRRFLQEGVRLSKIQISAALEIDPRQPETLRAFVEPVYLHQVKASMPDGSVRSWRDLPEALESWPNDALKTRVHFHVPLFWDGTAAIQPTSGTLTQDFWRQLLSGTCSHLEVETYSFGMMPEAVRPPNVVQSLALELQWVGEKLSIASGGDRISTAP